MVSIIKVECGGDLRVCVVTIIKVECGGDLVYPFLEWIVEERFQHL